MGNKIVKWLVFTVFVGLIPILLRILIKSVTNSAIAEYFSPIDFISLGLVLHISIINEIEHLNENGHEKWKTIFNGVSFIFITVYSGLLAVLMLNEKNLQLVNIDSMLIVVSSLVVVSLLISLSVFQRLSYALDGGEV